MSITFDAETDRWTIECDVGEAPACDGMVFLPVAVSDRITRAQTISRIDDNRRQYKDNLYEQIRLIEEYAADTLGWKLYKENEYDAIHVCPQDIANVGNSPKRADWVEDSDRKLTVRPR